MDKLIDLDPDFRLYGLSAADILKMSRWLMANNATVNDLDCSSLNRHHWEKMKLFEFLKQDFN